MRRRFPSVDNRPESELAEEARLIFNSQLDAITEIGTVLLFGSKTFLTRRAMEEQRSVQAGVPLPRDVIGERAYFVDCLNDKSAAFAKRWESLVQNSPPGLGERRTQFKARHKRRLPKIEEFAMVYLWAQTIVLEHAQIPPLCFLTDVAATQFFELVLPTVAYNVSGVSTPTDRTLSLGAFRQRRKRFKLRPSRFSFVDAIEAESRSFRLLFGLRKNPRWKIGNTITK